MTTVQPKVEQILQIHVAMLATLAGILVDVSQQRPLLTFILLLASITSIIVTDRRRWFQLPRFVVSLITLGAVLPLLSGFLEANTLEQLLAISHLLTIWLAVMFFQAKTPRVYGSLIVLSLLMVVVATVLSGGPIFGLLLLCYVFAGLSAMCYLHVHREDLLLTQAAQRGARREAEANRMEALDTFLRGEAPIAYQVPPGRGDRGLWVTGLPWQISGLGLATLLFAAGFFYFIPRLGQGDWSHQRPGSETRVGFSSRLNFEEMGEILESNQLAMRVAFYEQHSNTLYPIFGDCYFFGQALASYHVDERGQASWRPYESWDDGRPLRPPRTVPPGEIVRQEYILEPVEDATVFSISPSFAIRGDANSLLTDRHHSRLLRMEPVANRTRKQFRYILNTSGFRNGAQVPMVPYLRTDYHTRATTHQMPPYEREMLTYIDRTRFPGLAQLAQQIVQESEEPDNRILVIRRLQSHFLNETQYLYTLDMREVNARRNFDLDPIEDFVVNHHRGHCKYFASALVLMLRSQNIPARLVVGYHGGEYNRLGKYYQVYERDAHAWVEAYLEPEHVPEGVFGETMAAGEVAWYRLDPTPGRTDAFVSGSGLFRAADQALDYVQLLWTNWVLDMNPDRQTDVGLERMAEDGTEYLANLRVVRLGVNTVRNLLEPDRPEDLATAAAGQRWALLMGCLALLILLAAGGLFGWRFARRRRRRRGTVSAERARQLRRAQAVAFYLRLEALLQRLGHHRRPTQTQREFIHAVNGGLAALGLPSGKLPPEELVELYYRVRFGQQELGAEETMRVSESLDQLESALRSRPPSKVPRD